MTLRRRTLVVLAAAAAAVVVAIPASAGPTSGGANNVVLVSATLDGDVLARAGTQVVPVGGPAVSSANIATATSAGCTGCFSTAVAVQVLFVTGNPSVFTPGNAAVAANGGCTSCGSFAFAWQYVVQTDGPAHLSPDAQRRVAELRQEISDTAASIVPDSLAADQELQARLDALTDELQAVVDSELAQAGIHATGAPERHVDAVPAGS
jgi:hypothetical protein